MEHPFLMFLDHTQRRSTVLTHLHLVQTLRNCSSVYFLSWHEQGKLRHYVACYPSSSTNLKLAIYERMLCFFYYALQP